MTEDDLKRLDVIRRIVDAPNQVTMEPGHVRFLLRTVDELRAENTKLLSTRSEHEEQLYKAVDDLEREKDGLRAENETLRGMVTAANDLTRRTNGIKARELLDVTAQLGTILELEKQLAERDGRWSVLKQFIASQHHPGFNLTFSKMLELEQLETEGN